MHWVTAARHVAAGDDADHHRGQQGTARHPGRAQLRRPHRPGVRWPTRSSASTSARTGSASSPDADYDKTLATIEEVVDGYPGLYRDVQTYLKERIREVLTGAGEAIVVRIFGPTSTCSRHKAEEVEAGARRRSTASSTCTSSCRPRSRRFRSRSTSTRPSATAQAGRCPPGLGDPAWPARRSATSSSSGKAYDVQVWSTPEARHSVDRHPRYADRHADRRARAAGDVADVAYRADAERDQARGGSRRIDVGANVKGRDLGAVAGRRARRGSSRRRVPARYHAEVLGEYAERQAAQQPPATCSRSAPRSGSSFCCRRRSAAGGWRALSFLTLPSALVGGVLAAYARRRHDLARLAGRVPHRARHRRPQRHHADQPLPASGARTRARPFGPELVAARRARAAARRS